LAPGSSFSTPSGASYLGVAFHYDAVLKILFASLSMKMWMSQMMGMFSLSAT
jgi:hypothetical protein